MNGGVLIDLAARRVIKRAARKNNLTLFVGNGLSRILGKPSWEELANRMLDEVFKLGDINYAELSLFKGLPPKIRISIADAFFKSKKQKKLVYQRILGEVETEDNNESDNNNCYTKLAGFTYFGIKKFITTNYDLSLYDSFKKRGLIREASASESSAISDQSDSFYFFDDLMEFSQRQSITDDKILLYLHGSIKDESKIIASTESYIARYGDAEIQESLDLLLKNQTIIVMGYELNELEIFEFLTRNARKEGGDVFLFLPCLFYQQKILAPLKSYWQRLGITLLDYSIDDYGYEQIKEPIELLEELLSAKE